MYPYLSAQSLWLTFLGIKYRMIHQCNFDVTATKRKKLRTKSEPRTLSGGRNRTHNPTQNLKRSPYFAIRNYNSKIKKKTELFFILFWFLELKPRENWRRGTVPFFGKLHVYFLVLFSSECVCGYFRQVVVKGRRGQRWVLEFRRFRWRGDDILVWGCQRVWEVTATNFS